VSLRLALSFVIAPPAEERTALGLLERVVHDLLD
jgi:hypothetical protein